MSEERLEKNPRSMKPGQWYWVDKAVVQEQARKEGLLAIGVYHFLASMADESQSCFPSQKYIARKLGCSRGSVNKVIKRLVEDKLISMWKTPGKRTVYQLLPVDMSDNGTGVSDKNTMDVSKADTNNNKRTRGNNDNVVSVHKNYATKDGLNDEADARSRQELLAHDLSAALNDQSHYSIYHSYAKQYSESFLRRVLAETKMTPDSKIRKSRAALFNYLLHHYAGKGN